MRGHSHVTITTRVPIVQQPKVPFEHLRLGIQGSNSPIEVGRHEIPKQNCSVNATKLIDFTSHSSRFEYPADAPKSPVVHGFAKGGGIDLAKHRY